MRTVTVGTAGHIDHGKTALVRALTGVDTDRLPEEKQRGITIDLGFAHFDLGTDLRIAITDVPGHEAFVRNMAAGASGVDLGLLVIAADEGVMPQTREHLAILELLGVRPGAVVLSKADLVDPEWLELVRDDVHAELADTAFGAAPIVATSTVTGQGMAELRALLQQAALNVQERSTADLFRLPIDRVFTVRGTGTVVTGTVWSGQLQVEDAVRLLPSGISARVKGLQQQGAAVTRICAGERAAIALAGVAHDAVARGETLVSSNAWEAASALTIYLRVLPDAPRPLKLRDRVHLHLGTATTVARVRPLMGSIQPGATGWAVLRLEQPVVARAGDRFILRSYSPVTTIAGGIVYEATTRPERRRAAHLPLLERLRGPALRERLNAAVELAGWRGLPLGRVPFIVTGEPGVAPDLVRAGDTLFSPVLMAETSSALLRGLADLHERYPLRPFITLERFRQAAPPGAGLALRQEAEARLQASGAIVVRGRAVRLPKWEPRLTPSDEARLLQIQEQLQRNGLTPPAVAELGSEPELEDYLRLLEARQQATPIAPELYMDPAAVRAAQARLRSHLAGGRAAGPAELRDLLGISRKYLIPLLEYFDREGITIRKGDLRTFAEAQAVPDLPGATL
jgi:selenocysteine-specific elongation factor